MVEASRIFISYAGVDRPWAEWAHWHLRHAGYDTELDCVDWKAGDNRVEKMSEALARTNPMLALLSSAYLDPGRFTMDEWTARFAQRRADSNVKLIPARIDGIDLQSGIWAPIVVPSLTGLAPEEAAESLLEVVQGVLGPPMPGVQPRFPESRDAPASVDPGPRPPGSLPRVWNVDRRNPAFTGRDDVLNRVHDGLSGDGRVAVQAVHGMGGVGKTQLALEYAYRFAGEYDLVWWISAEQTGLIGEQFVALGVELGIIDVEADSTLAKSKVLGHLAGLPRSLLIFDNVESGEDVLPWLPRGGGHVLITSRRGSWQRIAHAVELDVLPRAEAVRFLIVQQPGLDAGEADQLADALGDLPLALAQAAGYLSETGMPVAEYRELLVEETQAVLALGRPIDYPQSLAAAITLNVAALAEVDPAAVAILRLCALLAPEPIPVDVIVEVAQPTDPYPEVLEALREVIGKRLARQESIGRIGAYGLARLGPGTVTVHRLTQAVVRSQMEQAASAELSAHLEPTLGRMNPGDSRDPANWPAWARLLPHVLAVGPAHTSSPVLRQCVREAIVYLINRGDAGPAGQLAENLHAEWAARLGPDHRDTLGVAGEVLWALRDLGEYGRLRPLVDDTLTRQIKTLGEDHPDTLRSAADLSIVLDVLGDHRRSEELGREVWERQRRVLGEDHPDTLMSAAGIATSLGDLGRHREALAFKEKVWEQRRRVLGEEHPDTLMSACNVASSLGDLGQLRESLALHEQAWEQRRRVLGEEHPDTLMSASNVASLLGDLGRHREALELMEKVWDQYRRVLGEEHPATLRSANNAASALGNLGRHREALALKEKVHERQRRVLGEEHPDTLKSMSNAASSLGGLGRHREALALREKVWEQRRRVLGEDHPEMLAAASNVASSMWSLGRHGEALELQEQVWEQYRRVLGEEHPDTLKSGNNVASSMWSLGRHAEALALHERVWEQHQRVLGEEHPETLRSASNVASSMWSLGRHGEALALREQVWQQRRRALGNDHPDTQRSALILAKMYLGLGRIIPARQLTDEALKGLRRHLGAEHPDVQEAAKFRDLVALKMGGRTGARKGKGKR
ncbi:ATP-binding protein [Actinoplanes italicus]|uniref:Tetratricopeptide repeat protein n=1 Tax=Actinoplanes italicus TaxID=113567 RepID=A0A2T0KF58_9ACTN|nr:FxSxx-COOH system tetratricopeptide repeat protein [Actinoplanes italicus]PRX21993.1 tetratricopeptide repeat protein [Actinoplanes italicus]GIE29590.1 ATP-binding protein [Actinoplanes italicus]